MPTPEKLAVTANIDPQSVTSNTPHSVSAPVSALELSAPDAASLTGANLRLRYVPLRVVDLWNLNPKKHDIGALVTAFQQHGYRDVPVWDITLNDGRGGIASGNGRTETLMTMFQDGMAPPRNIAVIKDTGEWAVPVIFGGDAESEAAAKAYAIDANNLTLSGGEFTGREMARLWVEDDYTRILEDIAQSGIHPVSVDGDDLDDLLQILAAEKNNESGDSGKGDEAKAKDRAARGSLAEKFGVVPFSVLDARSGWWQKRKQAWLSLGIQSEVGRDGNLTWNDTAQSTKVYGVRNELRAKLGRDPQWSEVLTACDEAGISTQTGTSVFDPVLCEIALRWFARDGFKVLDPFAGGSVRGVVSAMLGLEYTGIELRTEQVEANRDQWAYLHKKPLPLGAQGAIDPDGLTPVEDLGNAVLAKREDLYRIGRATGGKARTIRRMILDKQPKGIAACGSRESTMISRAAQTAEALNVPCRIHTASGPDTSEMRDARASGAEIVQHSPGYLTVIKARCRTDANKPGWLEIPWGAECQEGIDETAKQTANIPGDVQRIVVTVGGGMTLAGIIEGLKRQDRKIPILGVVVGTDPTERLDKWQPDWRDYATLVESPQAYEDHAPIHHYQGLSLDPIYEAKVIPYLAPGDLFWIVGVRSSYAEYVSANRPTPTWYPGDSRRMGDILPQGYKAKLLFSCPPYFDLEKYSEDPSDLSNLSYPDFRAAYHEIIQQAVQRLDDNSFAVWVIGDVRDKATGLYRNLINETIQAFQDAGMGYYNEGILLTAIGSVSTQVSRQFTGSRKLGKVHQQVLVFVKGDAKLAAQACGLVEFGNLIPEDATDEPDTVEPDEEITAISSTTSPPETGPDQNPAV